MIIELERVIDRLREELRDELLVELRADQSRLAGPEWMNVGTAARYLDVSPERIRKLQSRREIPFHQEAPGCRVLFRRRDLDDWMAGFRQPRAGHGRR